jgi:uncharacterized repeat protein (TIGR03803 family)
VFDKAGNLYGATTGGGTNCAPIGGECGLVFELSPPAKQGDPWTESIVFTFKGEDENDASAPTGGLIIDGAGNLYGVTAYGGTGDCVLLGVKAGCGTVYELSPPATQGDPWTETLLYSFKSGSDGYFPWGTLTFDANGNLYGATQFGGGKGNTCNEFYGGNCGTVFELSPPKQKGGAWTEKVLYRFPGVANGKQSGDGANPNGGLVLDNKGAIYGTTYYGGNNQAGKCKGGVGGTGCGTVFKLTPPPRKKGAWTEELLHRFDLQDGVNPAAGVILDRRGNLYGTTYGGPKDGNGLIFELTKPSGNSHSWTETELHLLNGGNDGAYPDAGLVFGAAGNLYGTASVYGGGLDYGTVFRLKPSVRKAKAWDFGVLYAFPGVPNGRIPTANLIFDKSGNLYSTTTEGGTGTCGYFGCGTVFQVPP